jgi:hypothetical protein
MHKESQVPAVIAAERPITSEANREARVRLAGRLRERAGEIEKVILAAVLDLSAPSDSQPADYAEGLRITITETVDYAVSAIEKGQSWDAPAPPAAVEQARRAARSGISLDTVMRRYAAGDRVFAVFVVDEADGLPRDVRQEIQRMQGSPVDRLMARVATEYRQELARIRCSPTSQMQERVRRLLEGETDAEQGLGYDLKAWHIGIATSSSDAEDSVRSLASRLDCQSLVVGSSEGGIWTWLGRRRAFGRGEIDDGLESIDTADWIFAIGEPRAGVEGWRLTHREAKVSLESLLHTSTSIVRSRDVVLAAAVLSNPTFTDSLIGSYLEPLDTGAREEGEDLRKTLRAYFAKGQNASTAGVVLGVDRRTVPNRLRRIEERLGLRIEDCHAELQVALMVEEILDARASTSATSTNQSVE